MTRPAPSTRALRLALGLALMLGSAAAAPPAPVLLRATQAWRLAHQPQVDNAAWSADANAIVGCIDGREPAAWDAATGALLRRIKAPARRVEGGPCSRTSISADGRVIGVEDPKGMQLIDVQTGALVAVLPGVDSPFVLDHDPTTGAFAVTTQGTVDVWIPPAGAPALRLPVNHGVESVRFSKKGTRLTAITRQSLNKARDRLKRPIIRSITWSLPTGKVRKRGRGPTRPEWTHRDPSRALKRVIAKAQASGDVGGWLAAPQGDQVLVTERFRHLIYNRKTLAEPVELKGMAYLDNRVIAMSPSTDQVAVGGHDGSVRVYRVGQPARRLGAHPSYVKALALSANGAWLASGSHEGWAVWDLASGAKVHVGEGSIESMAFSGDSTVLAVAASEVELWDTQRWSLRSTLEGSAIVVPTPTGFLLGRYDSSGTATPRAPLAELTPPAWTPRPLAPTHVHVRAFSRSPTGQIVGAHIVRHSVSTDVRVWEADKADAVLKWDRPGAPEAVAVGPHGWIASLGWDQGSRLSQVSLWHPATGETAKIEGHVVPNASSKTRLYFGNNGKGLVALDAGGGVSYWAIDAPP